jgi:hypothetical protein
VLCALFVANYIYGWVLPRDIDFFDQPASITSRP